MLKAQQLLDSDTCFPVGNLANEKGKNSMQAAKDTYHMELGKERLP